MLKEDIINLKESGKYTWQEIANIVNEKYNESLTETAVRKRWYRMRDKEETIEIEFDADGNVSLFDQLVEATGIDTQLFDVEKGSVWGSIENPSASFKFKRKELPTKEQVYDLLECLTTPNWPVTTYKENTNEKLGIVSIYDVHLEKLSVHGSGLQETKKLYQQVLDDLLFKMEKHAVGQTLMVIGNDFSNSDTVSGTTTAGTPQRNSVGWRIGIDEQCELAVWSVNQLLQHAPIHVKFVNGNHDQLSNYWLGKTVQAWFKGNNQVEVDNGHSYRKYYQWGVNGFMFTHGDKTKQTEASEIFAKEAPLIWANTKYRESHMGHFHGRKVVFEKHGFIVKYMPSMSNSDDWHDWSNYIGNNRGGQIGIYDPVYGLDTESFAMIYES